MFKRMNSTIFRSAAISTMIYLVVVALTLLEGDNISNYFFGKALLALIFVGPVLIVMAVVIDIVRERARIKNEKRKQ